jgi:hypothetical protein
VPSAKARSARSTPCTRLPSIRLVKPPFMLRVSLEFHNHAKLHQPVRVVFKRFNRCLFAFTHFIFTLPLQESVVMTESSPDMVVRQSPSSTKRPRPPRRLCCVSSARLARPVTCTLSSAASISRLVVRRRTKTASTKRDASHVGARASAACLPGLFHFS